MVESVFEIEKGQTTPKELPTRSGVHHGEHDLQTEKFLQKKELIHTKYYLFRSITTNKITRSQI